MRIGVSQFQVLRHVVLEDLGRVNLLTGSPGPVRRLMELLYLSGSAARPGVFLSEAADWGVWRCLAPAPDFMGRSPIPRLRNRLEAWEKPQSPLPALTPTPEGGLHIVLPDLPEGHLMREFIISVPPDMAFRPEEVGEALLVAFPPLGEKEPYRTGMKPAFFEGRAGFDRFSFFYLLDPSFGDPTAPDPMDRMAVWAIEGFPPARAIFLEPWGPWRLSAPFVRWALERAPGWLSRVEESLRRVFPGLPGNGRLVIEEVPDGDERIGYLVFPDRPPEPLGRFGDEIPAAMVALAGLAAMAGTAGEQRPDLFLWERPECAIVEPGSLRRMIREILDLIAGRPVQVFIATWSPDVLAAAAELLENPPEGVPREDWRLVQLAPRANGEIRAMVAIGGEILGWLEWEDPRAIEDDLPLRTEQGDQLIL